MSQPVTHGPFGPALCQTQQPQHGRGLVRCSLRPCTRGSARNPVQCMGASDSLLMYPRVGACTSNTYMHSVLPCKHLNRTLTPRVCDGNPTITSRLHMVVVLFFWWCIYRRPVTFCNAISIYCPLRSGTSNANSDGPWTVALEQRKRLGPSHGWPGGPFDGIVALMHCSWCCFSSVAGMQKASVGVFFFEMHRFLYWSMPVSVLASVLGPRQWPWIVDHGLET